MGKIRIKELGDEQEEQKKQEAKKKKEAKKIAKAEPVVNDVETPVILGTQSEALRTPESDPGQASMTEEPKKTKKKKFAKNKKSRSAKYKEARQKIDPAKKYALKDALELLSTIHLADFDETVELHINTEEAGISGNIDLPHGTGKKLRVAIASDQILAEVEKGKINFDVLLAQPAMMPKLAKVAKILGPRGLMPNPKNGTITQNPEETAKKYEGGHMNYKTEAKTPVMHMSVGKLSFGDKKLQENIETFLSALKNTKVKKAVLKSTMSPGIKLQL